MFYNTYLQEYNAWHAAGNTFIESHIVFQMDPDENDNVLEENWEHPNIKRVQKEVEEQIETNEAIDFIKKLDRIRFTNLTDDLKNLMLLGVNNYSYAVVEAMQLAIIFNDFHMNEFD
jgi:hypothetical protein